MASTNKTSKGLSQFLGTDRLQRDDYNNDMKKIDDELNGLDQNKEPKITKKGGFNKEKTDSVTTDSSVILATAKAIKTVWDALTSHRNSTSNPHIVTKNQVGLGNVPNYTITDSTTDGSSLKFGSAKAIKTVWNKALEILGLTNTNKNAIQNNTEQIENLSYNETLLFDGRRVALGEIALNDNWDNFREIVVVGVGSSYGNTNHRIFLTSEIIPSDTTTSQGDSECTFFEFASTYISGKFRDTDRSKVYITESSGGATVKRIIGINKKI